MKVKELMELLSKCDPDLYVMSEDHDNWFYDLSGHTREVKVFKGRECDEEQNGIKALVLKVY